MYGKDAWDCVYNCMYVCINIYIIISSVYIYIQPKIKSLDRWVINDSWTFPMIQSMYIYANMCNDILAIMIYPQKGCRKGRGNGSILVGGFDPKKIG